MYYFNIILLLFLGIINQIILFIFHLTKSMICAKIYLSIHTVYLETLEDIIKDY